MENILYNFLNDVTNKGGERIIYTNLKSSWKRHGEITEKNDVYFTTGLKKGIKTRKDKDIERKCYFAIDIDIRKQMMKVLNREVKDLEILQEIENIKSIISINTLFKDYKHLVFTGNGVHIYYILQNVFDATKDDYNVYNLGIKSIFESFDNIMKNTYYNCDLSCNNISQLFRLPNTVNTKKGNTCYIYESTNNISSFDVKTLGNIRKEKMEKELSMKNEDAEKHFIILEKLNILLGKETKKEDYDIFFRKVNKEIKAYNLVQKLFPYCKFDGDKRFLFLENGKIRSKGFFYVEEYNAICNGGSNSAFNWGDRGSCYQNSIIIKNHFNYEWSEVIEYFKQNFNIN